MTEPDREAAHHLLAQGIAAALDKSQPSHLQIAYQLYQAALFTDPTFAEAWYNLGCANYDIGLLPAAAAAYRRAEATADQALMPKLLGNLGWTLTQMGGRSREARDCLQRAIAIDPKLSKAYFSLSFVLRDLNDMAGALRAAYRARELDPCVETEMCVAFALLFDRQWAKGLRAFEARFPYKFHNYLKFPYPKWDGRGGHLFLAADQGLGDTLSYSRFLPEAAKRCDRIWALIQPALLRLFTYSFAHLQNVTFLPDPSPFPPAHAWTTFVSLPSAMGLNDREYESTPAPALWNPGVGTDWKLPGRRLHVGVAFAGSPLNDIDRHRNLPLDLLMEVGTIPGVQLYSLQVGERVADLHSSGAGGLIRDLSPWISDVSDTVALLGHLDMVLTCESFLGHIAGALGMECWIPYSWNGRDYRLGPTGDRPLWYARHRAWPQGEDAQWGPVFKEIRRALFDRACEQRAEAAE